MRRTRLTRLALGEAGASPWRNWPLALGVALGVACLVYFLSLASGVEELLRIRVVGSLPNRIKVQPSSFKVGPLALQSSINQATVDKLRALPGVTAVYRQARLPQPCQLYASYGGQSVVTDMIVEGVDPGLVSSQVASGRSFAPTPSDPYTAVFPLAAVEIVNAGISIHTGLPTLTPEAIVGHHFELLVGTSSFSPGQSVRRRCVIVGVSDQIAVSGPALPLEVVEQWEGKPLTYYSVTLEVDTPERVEAVAAAVEELGLATPGLEMARRIATGVIWARIALVGFAAAILLIAGVGISTGLSLQVREEARFIGLYRAVGATQNDIRWIYLARAGALGLVGSLGGLLLGLVGGYLTQWAVAHFGPSGVLLNDRLFAPTALILFSGLSFGVIGCLLAGAYPARQAARLSPVEALRTG